MLWHGLTTVPQSDLPLEAMAGRDSCPPQWIDRGLMAGVPSLPKRAAGQSGFRVSRNWRAGGVIMRGTMLRKPNALRTL
jgi:hypothetical protein